MRQVERAAFSGCICCGVQGRGRGCEAKASGEVLDEKKNERQRQAVARNAKLREMVLLTPAHIPLRRCKSECVSALLRGGLK